ncbi:MAG: DUF3592 domain-containing protein [Candidatus Acidiferrales bacterium]
MKILRLFFGVFAVVGVGLLIGGVVAIQHTRHFLATAISVPGVVTENVWHESRSQSSNSTHWAFYPRIRFRTTDGQEISFITNTGSSPPAYRVNEPVTILYEPQQPYHAYIRSFSELWLLPTILFPMGVIFCSFGAVAVIWKGISARTNVWLEQNGRRIQAEFTRVELNKSLEVNGANPYRIVCQWLDPASNQIHIFHSANIWFDPTNYIPGKMLDVLVDPNRPHRYLVETPFLPKEV